LNALEEMTARGGVFDAWQNLIALLAVASLSAAAIIRGRISKTLIKGEAFFAAVLFLFLDYYWLPCPDNRY